MEIQIKDNKKGLFPKQKKSIKEEHDLQTKQIIIKEKILKKFQIQR